MNDENDKLRAGTLGSDPFADADPMNGDPGDDHVDNDLDRIAPTIGDAFGPDELASNRLRELLSVDDLPDDHGLGKSLDDILGGGLHRGSITALGAKSAGAGKTMLLMQLAEGFALRTAELLREGKPGVLTPVLLFSEMTAEEHTCRALGRVTRSDSGIFRAGKSAEGLHGREYIDSKYAAAASALRSGLLSESRRYIRILVPPFGVGTRLVAHITRIVNLSVEKLFETTAREIWPIVVLDPVHRGQDPSKNSEVVALNELVDAIGQEARKHGWIVLCTADTNKGAAAAWEWERSGGRSAKKTVEEAATGAIRGSYELFHVATTVLFLFDISPASETTRKTVLLLALKNRWGPQCPHPNATVRYYWYPREARFEPLTREQIAELLRGTRDGTGEPDAASDADDERWLK